MALCKDGSKYYIKFWMGYNQPRPKLYLGNISKRQAIAFNNYLNSLTRAKRLNLELDDAVVKWLSGVDDKVRRKLEQWQLVEPKTDNIVFIDLVQQYIDRPCQTKDSTKQRWKDVKKKLDVFFGDKFVADITSRDAEKLKYYLQETAGLNENTARKYISITRQFLGYAVELEYIDKNPFTGQKTAFIADDNKQFFITPEMSDKVLDACPDAQWRLIWSLARYGGLRVPSEVLAMKWTDVNFDNNSFIVRSSKTEHQGKSQRMVPIFPELKKPLQDAFDNAKPGDVYCVSRYRDVQNLRTQMSRIIERAGLIVWNKIFVNCRSTRQTELLKMTNGNIKVVCSWLGNSPAVALKHYAQMTDTDMKEAVKSELLGV